MVTPPDRSIALLWHIHFLTHYLVALLLSREGAPSSLHTFCTCSHILGHTLFQRLLLLPIPWILFLRIFSMAVSANEPRYSWVPPPSPSIFPPLFEDSHWTTKCYGLRLCLRTVSLFIPFQVFSSSPIDLNISHMLITPIFCFQL